MVPSKINSEVVDEFCFVSAIATRTFNDSSKILDFFGAEMGSSAAGGENFGVFRSIRYENGKSRPILIINGIFNY